MSIWASWPEIGYDFSAKDWEGNGEVRSYANGWSNHYPTADVETPANVGISTMPIWCVPGHEDASEDFAYGPWLRLDMYTQAREWATGVWGGYDLHSVILDRQAARSLAADLLAWADSEHAEVRERQQQ